MKKTIQCLRKPFIFLILLSFTTLAFAAPKYIYVQPDGTGDGLTGNTPAALSQFTINQAADGDTIILKNGIYYLNDSLNIYTKITFQSENGWEKCEIDAINSYYAKHILNIAASDVRIKGIHFSGATFYSILCYSNTLIENCKFSRSNNGINVYAGSTPTIKTNIFESITENSIEFALGSPSFYITNNTFWGNLMDFQIGIKLPTAGIPAQWNIYNNVFNYFYTAIDAYSGFTPGQCVYNLFTNNISNSTNFSLSGSNITNLTDPLIDPYTFKPIEGSPCINAGHIGYTPPIGFKTRDIGALPYLPQTFNCNADFTAVLEANSSTVNITNFAFAESKPTISWFFDFDNFYDPYYGIDTIMSSNFQFNYDYTGLFTIAQIINDKTNNCIDTAYQTVLLRDQSCQTYIETPTILANGEVQFNAYNFIYGILVMAHN
jgi:hypothetical protein